MAETLTNQQRQAVYDRGGKLLVSAAAGSGKTKVLVDRLMSYLLDRENPANLDDFLMITYTKAAAAELRGKIAAKLTEKMAEYPESRHLQQQMQRLYLAKISTVHSFCSDILREYAYRLNLPADFRVADENECRELREAAMAQVLERAYDNLEENPNFRVFLDTQGLGRDDRLVPDILMRVYDSSRCHISPDQWLDACVENARVEKTEDAAQTVWGKYLVEDLFAYLDLQIDAFSQCVTQAFASDGMSKPAELLSATLEQLRALRKAATWDEIYEKSDVDYGRLTFPKTCTDLVLIERIKAVRDACKKGLAKKLKSFSGMSEEVLSDMQRCGDSVSGMVQLVRQFEAEYQRRKKLRRVLDFGDLEQRMLDLLTGVSRTQVTAAATEIGSRFREIMVDEYQDSNAVQDAIFSALTQQKQNLFMVGDVKQSIYQFRLADPNIFLQKYHDYVPAEKARGGQGRKVLLSHNFRSGGGVLQGANDVFTHCMSPAVGGLYYTDEEALKEGIPHEALGEAEVELLALQVQESTYPEEAALVANRVAELLDGTHFVRGKDGLRAIKPEDIAILLRSPGSVGSYYIRALEQRGIRCVSGGGEDLFQTEEIGFLRALLQIIGNPRQDIPLLAVLSSAVFCLTADDLAALRQYDHRSCIYDLLLQSEAPKVQHFLSVLEKLRKAAMVEPLTKLLETVFSLTHLDSLYGAMEEGQLRKEHLQSFYTMAAEHEAAGQGDLGRFLAFLDNMEKKGLIAAGQEGSIGAVTLMSIHKSKGLEFPVVFVSGLSRSFNQESLRAQVLCDQELGLGLSAVDEGMRVRYPTIAKRAIMVKTAADSLSEEMRVLYVALTRARDRLIMTYASGNLESDIASLVQRMGVGKRELMCRDVVCPGEWVLIAALHRTEAGELFQLGGNPQIGKVSQWPWRISVTAQAENSSVVAQNSEQQEQIPENLVKRIKAGLEFSYPYMHATTAPSKQTATQRKGRHKDAETAENAPKQETLHWRKPSFVKAGMEATAYGTAVHSCMQHIDYGACIDEVAVKFEVERLVMAGILSKEQGEIIPVSQIAAFFQTVLGKKLQSGSEVLREFKFSILEDGVNYDEALAGEQILLQGVVDCALVENDGITVVDFKTDYVTEETVGDRCEVYSSQIRAYAQALSRIYEKPVKESVLYFFRLGKFVSVELL